MSRQASRQTALPSPHSDFKKRKALSPPQLSSPDSVAKKLKFSATPAPPSSDSPFIRRSVPIGIPASKGDSGEGQPSPTRSSLLPVGTPLKSARQPPRPSIPFMDRVIIDPGRHAPPPYTGKALIRREDLRTSYRANPKCPNPNDPPPKDKFFRNQKVSRLDYNNFTEFLSRRDVTLVTFYTPGDFTTSVLADVISQASCATKRANHAYAGVNCRLHKKLCKDNDITNQPAVRIYYRANCLGEVKDIDLFTPERARLLVEQAPNLDSDALVKVYNK